MDGEPGDLLLFAADKKKVVWDVLGALRLHLAKSLDLLKKDDFRFLWVTEFPLLEWSEEQNRFVAMHHPFTMPMEEDLDKIDSDPGAVRAQAYDIVLNGNEIGGGSVRIHQDDIQSRDVRSTWIYAGTGTETVRIPSGCIQIWSTATRRTGIRTGSSDHADGRRRQHP